MPDAKQEEIKLKVSEDKTPPKIIIAKTLTFQNSSYKIEGKVEDKGSKNIYVEIDGVIQNAKNGKFIFERFSPIDETVKIVAIDQWGNRSKEKIVKIKIENKSSTVVKKLEKLNPLDIKTNILNKKINQSVNGNTSTVYINPLNSLRFVLNKVKKDKINLGKDFWVFTGSSVGVVPIKGKGIYIGKIDKLGLVKAKIG